jgi:aldehyde dehydrogenase (NAD+)
VALESKKRKVSSSLFNFLSTDYILPCPYGVTLNISPWNYPFQLSISPIIGAISAGNTVVLKPSEHSPNTTNILKIVIEKSFERGHVDIVTGGPDIGQKLLELNWDYIFFTGSTEIGKIVAKEAASNTKFLTNIWTSCYDINMTSFKRFFNDDL